MAEIQQKTTSFSASAAVKKNMKIQQTEKRDNSSTNSLLYQQKQHQPMTARQGMQPVRHRQIELTGKTNNAHPKLASINLGNASTNTLPQTPQMGTKQSNSTKHASSHSLSGLNISKSLNQKMGVDGGNSSQAKVSMKKGNNEQQQRYDTKRGVMNQSTVHSMRSNSNSWQTHIKREETQQTNASWFDWLLCGKTCNNNGDQFCNDYSIKEGGRASVSSKPEPMDASKRQQQNKAMQLIDTENSIIQLNESKDLGLTSNKSILSNNRFNLRTRDLSKPKYTNDELDKAIFDKNLPLSDIRKNEQELDRNRIEIVVKSSPRIVVSGNLVRNGEQLNMNISESSANLMMDIDEATPVSSQKTQLLYADRKQSEPLQAPKTNNFSTSCDAISTTQHAQQSLLEEQKGNAIKDMKDCADKMTPSKNIKMDNFEMGGHHYSTISSDKSIPEEIDDETSCQLLTTQQSRVSHTEHSLLPNFQAAEYNVPYNMNPSTKLTYSQSIQTTCNASNGFHKTSSVNNQLFSEKGGSTMVHNYLRHQESNEFMASAGINENSDRELRRQSHPPVMVVTTDRAAAAPRLDEIELMQSNIKDFNNEARPGSSAIEEDTSSQKFAKLEEQIISKHKKQSSNMNSQKNNQQLNSSVETEVVVSSLQQNTAVKKNEKRVQKQQKFDSSNIDTNTNGKQQDDEDLAEFERLEAELLAEKSQATSRALEEKENREKIATDLKQQHLQQQYRATYSNSQKTTPVDPRGGPRVTSKIDRHCIGLDGEPDELLQERIYEHCTPVIKQGGIHFEMDKFDSLEQSKSEVIQDNDQTTGDQEQALGIFHSSARKIHSVAVSQEVQDGGHLGLINIQTKRLEKVSEDHHNHSNQTKTIVEAHHEGHSKSSIENKQQQQTKKQQVQVGQQRLQPPYSPQRAKNIARKNLTKIAAVDSAGTAAFSSSKPITGSRTSKVSTKKPQITINRAVVVAGNNEATTQLSKYKRDAFKTIQQQPAKREGTDELTFSPKTNDEKSSSQSQAVDPLSASKRQNVQAPQKAVKLQQNNYKTAQGVGAGTHIVTKQRTYSMVQSKPMFQNQTQVKRGSIMTLNARRRSTSNRGGSKPRVSQKDQMAEIFERYTNPQKVTKIDLSATVPRHNSVRRLSKVNVDGTVPEQTSTIMSDALKQLTKSMRSESVSSLVDRQQDRSTSRKSSIRRNSSIMSKDLKSQIMQRSQEQVINNSSMQKYSSIQKDQILTIPNIQAIIQERDSAYTDIYSDTGTSLAQKEETPTAQESLNGFQLKGHKSSLVSKGGTKRSSSRQSKGNKMKDIYDRFRHGQEEDPEATKRKAIRQLRKSFASDRSDRSHKNQGNIQETISQVQHNRSESYDIYQNSAAEGQTPSNFNLQQSSTVNDGSSQVSGRRVNVNQQVRGQQHVAVTQDRVARQNALKNAPSPRIYKQTNLQPRFSPRVSDTSRQTAIFGSNKMNQQTSKAPSPYNQKRASQTNLKDRLTTRHVAQKQLHLQELKRSPIRDPASSRTYEQRQRSFTVRQKVLPTASDLEKFKTYSSNRRIGNTLQRNSSMHQITITSSIRLPSPNKNVRRGSQTRRDSSFNQRSKLTGYFAAQGSVGKRSVSKEVGPNQQVQQKNGGPMFAKAAEVNSIKRHTFVNSKSLPPTSMTFGRQANSKTVNRDSSRRSLSARHGRSQQQELESSPQRLSKIMSQKELLITNESKNNLTMKGRKASVSSAQNRLFDRKASLQSRNSYRSRSQNKATPLGMTKKNLKPAVPRFSKTIAMQATPVTTRQSRPLLRKNTKVEGLKLNGITSYGIMKTQSKPVVISSDASMRQVKTARFQQQSGTQAQRGAGGLKPSIMNKSQKTKIGQQPQVIQSNVKVLATETLDTGNSALNKRAVPRNNPISSSSSQLQPPFKSRGGQVNHSNRFQ